MGKRTGQRTLYLNQYAMSGDDLADEGRPGQSLVSIVASPGAPGGPRVVVRDSLLHPGVLQDGPCLHTRFSATL
jgi:hypothetical protein